MASQDWISNSTSSGDRENSSFGGEAQASSSPPRKRQRQTRRASASSFDSQLPSSSDCKPDLPTSPIHRAHLQSQDQAQQASLASASILLRNPPRIESLPSPLPSSRYLEPRLRLPSLRPLPTEILPARIPFAAPTPRPQLPPLRPSQTYIQEGDRRRALPPVEPLQLPPLHPAGSPTSLGVPNPENQHEQVESPRQTALSLPSLRPEESHHISRLRLSTSSSFSEHNTTRSSHDSPAESEFQHSFQLCHDADDHHPFSNTRVKYENDSDEFEEEYISQSPPPPPRPHNRQLPHPLI